MRLLGHGRAIRNKAIGPVIAVVAALLIIGPGAYRGLSAQSAGSGPQAVISHLVPKQNFRSWLSACPVGMRLRETAGHRPAITSVEPDGGAARAGLKAGDIVLHVGDLDTPSADDMAEHIQYAWSAGKSAIDVIVSRDGNTLYIALRLRS